jgi:hypothetical protein
MGISDDLVSSSQTLCAFATLCQKLDKADQVAVVDFASKILEARRNGVHGSPFTASRLRSVLVDNGHTICINVLRDHLNGICCCRDSS